VTTHAQQYAGFWRRLGAVILDSMLVLTVTAPVLYLIYGHNYFYWLITQIDLLNVFGVWDFILTRALPILALLFFWRRIGATPGKVLMHCRIVDSKSLAPPGSVQAITRLLGYAVSSLPLYLGFFWIGWDKHKQGFHDKLAKTLVLYEADDYAEQSLQELIEGVS